MRKKKTYAPIVYKATNIVTGASYIGVTTRGLAERRSQHKSAALKHKRPGIAFHNAIRKYGFDAFRFEVMKEFVKYEDALAYEIEMIAKLCPRYNSTVGGQGALGYRHTPENIAKMSASKKGQPGYWKGKKLLPHVVENLRKVHASRADKERVLPLGPKSQMRRVVCLDDGKEYESTRAAAKAYGLCASSICTVCNRSEKRLTAGGRVFRYYGDHSGGKEEAAAYKSLARHGQTKHLNLGQGSYRRRVQCISDGRVFESLKRAADHYQMPVSTLASGFRMRDGKAWGMKFAYLDPR